MARTLITVPPSARRGEVIEIRTLIQHPMETGYRPGADGKVWRATSSAASAAATTAAARSSAELYAAVAANPLISFHTVATASGTLTFTWEGDNGFMQSESVAIKVT